MEPYRDDKEAEIAWLNAELDRVNRENKRLKDKYEPCKKVSGSWIGKTKKLLRCRLTWRVPFWEKTAKITLVCAVIATVFIGIKVDCNTAHKMQFACSKECRSAAQGVVGTDWASQEAETILCKCYTKQGLVTRYIKRP